MTSRVLKGACATVAVTAALGGAAQAAGPPPPTAANGAAVVQVAAGLGTPTAFAFGGGAVFEADGGNNQSGPPNGGVFVLRNGTATKPVTTFVTLPPPSGIDTTLPGLSPPNSDMYRRLPMIPRPMTSVCGAKNLNGLAKPRQAAGLIHVQRGKP